METKRNNKNRLGPLHTCGNAMLTTAYKVYKRAESLPNPMGSTTQKLARFMSPFLYPIQYHWLAILSFTDDQILTVENIVENVFPPSSYVFDKIDAFVHVSENLPIKFDNAIDKFPTMLRKVPCLDWALTQLILILNILITTLTNCEVIVVDNVKEIRVDSNPNYDGINKIDHGYIKNQEMIMKNKDNNNEVKETYKDILIKRKDINEKEQEEEESTVKEVVELSGEMKNFKREKETITYKTILEMGMKKQEEKEEEENQKQENEKKIVSLNNDHQKKIYDKVEVMKEIEDPILKLFSAAGWYDM